MSRRPLFPATAHSAFLKPLQRARFFYPYRNRIILLCILGFVSSLFLLAGPYLSRLYIDTSFIHKDLDAFIRLSVVGLAIFLFSTLAGFIEDIIRNRTFIRVKLSLAHTFIRKLYTFDLAFFQSRSVGENIYRISNIETIARFMSEDVPQIIVESCRLVIILGISLFVSFHLTVALVILSPLFLLQSLYIRKKMRPVFSEIWKSNARLSKRLQESLSKMQIIKALSLETFQRHFYIRLLIENIRVSVKGFRWVVVNSLSSAFLSRAIYGVLSLYGGWLIIKGQLSLGSYAAVMLYITQAGGLLGSLSYRLEYFVQQGVLMERFFEVIGSKPKIEETPAAVRIDALREEIALREVSFGYEPGKPVFNRLTLRIPAGKWVGITGPSGCGKTTLVNLILRLYEPQEGIVTLDGLDVRAIKIGSLRERIAIATQEPLLFDLSIKENICAGLAHISEQELSEMMRRLRAEEFIRRLPLGLDSVLGENACCLSQGYKQRIAIARAAIRKPDLLILDEATSSIDSAAETEILEALKAERRGLSTIVISHRLSTIKNSDVIYFFGPEGKIEAEGHDRLLTESPGYRRFFQDQLEKTAVV